MTKNVLWLILPSVGILSVHFFVGLVLPGISFSSESAIHDILKTLWMVEAALAGGLLILTFFAIESCGRMNPIEVTLARFQQAIAVYPVFGGLLAVLVGTGLAVVLTLPGHLAGITPMPGLQWFLVLDFLLFGVMAFTIGWLISVVIRYSVPSGVAYFNDVVARDGTTHVASYEFQEMLDKTPDLPASTFRREWVQLAHAFRDIHYRADAALHKQDLPDVEAAINFYRAVLEAWSEARQRCGIVFNIGENDSDWPHMPKALTAITRPLDRIFSDLSELILSNIDSYPSRGYKWLLSWPVNGLSTAVAHEDHLVFQRILELYEGLYVSINSRKSFEIAEEIITMWRDSWQGPEQLMVINLRRGLDPASDDSARHMIDYVRQLYDSNYCLTGLAFSSTHDRGAGNLIASHRTVQNLLWRVDAIEYKFSESTKERKALFDNERKMGMLMLLGLAAGEWWNGRCDVFPLNYLIETACTTRDASSEDFWSMADLGKASRYGTKRVEDKVYPPWLWRWIAHCPHSLTFPGESFSGMLEGSDLLSIGILLVMGRLAQQGGDEVLGEHVPPLVVPYSFDDVVGRMSGDLDRWSNLVCGESLCMILKALKTNKKRKVRKRARKRSVPT
ncbi:hypothetical protein ACFLWB_02115 [Chloroflexota bacterium]